jgi:P27 family predicted phage terminase small subunit
VIRGDNMAGRKATPVNINSKHLTSDEIAQRKEAEERLKGNDNRVYDAPDDLDEEEKETYAFLINELKSSKILSNLDIVILEQTVECMVQMKVITKEMKNKKSITDRSDLLSMYQKYFNLYLKCSAELG